MQAPPSTVWARLKTVNAGTFGAVYSNIANSPLVGQITLYTSGTVRMTTSKQYYRPQLPVTNTSAVWLSATNSATGEGSITGHAFVPATPEVLRYDADGNLTNDGHWAYLWDAENRLVKLAANTSVGPQISLQFGYDPRGRRVHKQVWSNTSWSGTPTNDVVFVYDLPSVGLAEEGGWNPIAQLNASNNAVLQSYVWGLDLSGSPQAAGGVGGLLAVTVFGTATNALVAYDGNGNVSALVSAVDGTALARYEYGPFGEVLRVSGAMAKANPYRFSTKYQDDETDLLYYGLRYYDPSTGRWNSRDPLEEEGGRNLYAFAYNEPTDQMDLLGMSSGWAPSGGAVGSIQLSYDFCKGDVQLSGWVWVGVGWEYNHHWVGVSAYYQGSPLKTWHVPPAFKCGKCSECRNSEDAAGLHAAAGYFKGGLFGTQIVEGGLLFTPGSSLCDGSVEGIVLINLINYLPRAALLVKAATLAGGKAEAGVQVNVDVHLCVGEHGGIVVDSASIGGAGYIAFGRDLPYSTIGGPPGR